jgi:transcription elongation factor GreB
MSRGFVKEDDQEEAPFVPPRAALPDGVPDHVTPRGLQLLLDERKALEAERAGVTGCEDDRRSTRSPSWVSTKPTCGKGVSHSRHP